MSSSEDEEIVNVKRKKGIVNDKMCRRNVIKKCKVSGKEHVNWVGKTVQAKKPGSNDCR